MLDNTARQLQPEEEALVQQPEPQPKPQVTAAPAAAPLAVPFSAFEKGLALLAGVLAVAVSIFCLFSQNQLANTQRQYEDVQSAITTQTQKINNYKQSIGELSNSERLSAFAKEHGLTVVEGNIKRVSK
ncbi:cell division protein FtsL [Lacticaseibacillus saniviri]|uniref:cell division protein FtsL n=1 Tax=Lacticaseibacillus saniviri TaxID=931533 RepID=UPI001EDE897F|nr:cell division protein FtsL [Lacticaseibacillus saniviri]MCG4282048.1 cell division protein FtsL [Lacticaseibacillus saniviri]